MWWYIAFLCVIGSTFASVTPEFNCVDNLGGDSCRFWWGFANNETGNVSLGVGPSNSFVPSPQDRGQDTLFPALTTEVNAFSYDAGCAGNVDTWSLNHTSLESDISNTSETCSDICGNGCLEYTEIFTEAGDPPHDCVRYIFKQVGASCFVQFFWIAIPQDVIAADIMIGECAVSFGIDHAPPCTGLVNDAFPTGKFLKVNLEQSGSCTVNAQINATVGIALGVALNNGGIGPIIIKGGAGGGGSGTGQTCSNCTAGDTFTVPPPCNNSGIGACCFVGGGCSELNCTECQATDGLYDFHAPNCSVTDTCTPVATTGTAALSTTGTTGTTGIPTTGVQTTGTTGIPVSQTSGTTGEPSAGTTGTTGVPVSETTGTTGVPVSQTTGTTGESAPETTGTTGIPASQTSGTTGAQTTTAFSETTTTGTSSGQTSTSTSGPTTTATSATTTTGTSTSTTNGTGSSTSSATTGGTDDEEECDDKNGGVTTAFWTFLIAEAILLSLCLLICVCRGPFVIGDVHHHRRHHQHHYDALHQH